MAYTIHEGNPDQRKQLRAQYLKNYEQNVQFLRKIVLGDELTT